MPLFLIFSCFFSFSHDAFYVIYNSCEHKTKADKKLTEIKMHAEILRCYKKKCVNKYCSAADTEHCKEYVTLCVCFSEGVGYYLQIYADCQRHKKAYVK